MVRRSSGSKKGKADKGLTLNFDGIETTSRVPDGDYAVKVKSVVLEDQKEKGTQYLKFSLAITEGKHAGKTLRHTNSLQPQALFALRNTLEALGFPIPSGAFELDLEAMVGLEMAVAVENEEYNGKDQSRVVDVFSSDDLAEAVDEDEDEDGDDEDDNEEDENTDDSDEDDDSEDDDDDEDSDDEDGDSDSDDDDDDDVEDYTEEDLKAMDEEELLEAAEEYEVKAKYKGKGDKKKLNKAATIKAILEVIESDDEDEDDE